MKCIKYWLFFPLICYKKVSAGLCSYDSSLTLFSFAASQQREGKMWEPDVKPWLQMCSLRGQEKANLRTSETNTRKTLTNRRRGKEHLWGNTSFWIIHLGNDNSTALLSNKERQSLITTRSCSPHFSCFQESQEWEIQWAPLFT